MFKYLLLFSVLITFLMIIGCGPSVTVKTDYDPSQDFNSYKTYQWWTGEQPDDQLTRNPLIKKRVIASVDKVLKEKIC